MADTTGEAPTVDKGARLAVQLKKLTEANAKYKNLLKLAKERIQQQEDELELVRREKADLAGQLEEEKLGEKEITLGADSDDKADELHNIVGVCQRIKSAVTRDRSQASQSNGEPTEEIWALLEIEVVPANEMDVSNNSRYFKQWRRFDTESELQDFIRRDTGEPLTLPPYSLSPEQSAKIQQESASKVSQVTEDFRRFRVRAELARKQAESQIRDLQSKKAQSAAMRIEGHDLQHELEQARSVTSQLDKMKAELAAQEAHWKEAYDVLLAENNALKSSGSEALLASQWRQRYETCLKEKEALEQKLETKGNGGPGGSESYEAKYRDLKESFRLYRKKAKEIFEAQERGAVHPAMATSSPVPMGITDASSAEAKLSYLKNLMVNYLTADQAVRDHMESAIGTVLQFTPDDLERIGKKKTENEAWF